MVKRRKRRAPRPWVIENSVKLPPSLFQAEEQVSGGRGDGAEIGAKTICDGIAARHPTAGNRYIGILLQGVTARGRPEDFDAIGSNWLDDEFWHPGHLNHIDQAPETTGHGELSARHRRAGIVLADGAAHGESAAGAGAAAGDFIPVHRVGLPGCPKAEGGMKQDEAEQQGETPQGVDLRPSAGDWQDEIQATVQKRQRAAALQDAARLTTVVH